MVIAVPTGARAQAYPSQDIRLICAFPPGSGADVLVRYFAREAASDREPHRDRGEQGRAPAATSRMEYVARAKPDGYTIFVHAATAVAANQHLFKKPPVDAAKAIQIAASINRQPFMLVVDAKSPYKTVADLTEAMKQEGRQGDLRDRGAHRHHHGRDLQGRHRGQGGRGELQDRARFAQRDAQRQDRLRHARSGVLARPAARGAAAHSRGQHRRRGCRRIRTCRR